MTVPYGADQSIPIGIRTDGRGSPTIRCHLTRDPRTKATMRPPCDELERLANERLRDARDLIAGGVTFERACEITGCDPDDPVSVAHLPGSTHPAPSPEQIAARAAEIRRGWSFATERARYTLGPERRKTFPGVAAMSGVREVAMSPVEN